MPKDGRNTYLQILTLEECIVKQMKLVKLKALVKEKTNFISMWNIFLDFLQEPDRNKILILGFND